MLYPALNYQNILKTKFREIWFKDKYKYYNNSCYYEDINIDEDTWYKHQFVSVKDYNVIGYIGYSINRQTNNIYRLGIINFEDKPSITFSCDLKIAIKDIFECYKFNKLSFNVVIGNPVEKAYDKLCEKYGGRIVGIQKNETKLIDGKIYDIKLYEITRDSYISSIINNKRKK